MPIYAATPEGIARAAALLRSGEVVAFPTETVYGLGAILWDARAVARVFEIKRRPAFDPLIVHLPDRESLDRVAASVPAAAKVLIDRFWPGGLTLVLPKRPEVPGLATAGLPTVAVRMPAHPAARALLHAAGEPLAAPSANPFGGLSPTRASHVARGLGERVELILDGGRSQHGVESTIVAFEPEPTLLRPGAIPAEEIEALIGPLGAPRAGAAVAAPGQLPLHYAPRTPLRIVEPARVPARERSRAGLLAFCESVDGYAEARVLSRDGDLAEAAAALFEMLHELDALGLVRIDAQPVPRQGLGFAIMDRLVRAAAER